MALLNQFRYTSPITSLKKQQQLTTSGSSSFTFPGHQRRKYPSLTASLADGDSKKKLVLEVKDLTAVIAETGKEILNGVNLSIYEGEVCYN